MSAEHWSDLWLCLAAGRRRWRARARAEPSLPAAELARLLASKAGLAGSWELHSALRGRLDGGSSLADLGLRTGEELHLVRPGGPGLELPEWELLVVGGPLAGSRFPLRDGEQTLGRSARADLRLRDRAAAPLHLRLSVDAHGVVAADLGSRQGTHLDGRPLRERRLEATDVLEVGRSLLRIGRREDPPFARAGHLFVDRRAASPVPLPPWPPLPAPPKRPRPARLPVAASLGPVLLGLGAWAASRNSATLVFALGAPLLALAPPLEERLARSWQHRRDQRRFRRQLAASEVALEGARRRRVEAARMAAPDLCELEERALRASPNLWERDAGHGFLRLRIGWGDVPDLPPALPDADERQRPRLEAVARLAVALPAAPLVLDLGSLGAAGLAGPRPAVEGLARCLLVQAAALHPPSALGFAAFLPAVEGWDWLRWLPHRVHLAVTAEERRCLAARLAELAAPTPLLVLVHEAAVAHAGPGPFLRELAGNGLHLLWVGSEPGRLPRACRAVLEVANRADRLVVREPNGEPERVGVPDLVSEPCADRVARALAAVREAGATGPPAVAGLAACLGASDLAAAVREWWSAAPDLAAPVGMTVGGPLVLDLRRDGPHALVAGTSGSGKSELLRSWVLGLAARHSPRRLNFLLVDFKGGTALGDCAPLPHVVGLVTDLGEHSLERLRLSLLAELKRREAALAEAGEKEFADWERRDPGRAPAALVVVFDEFEQLLTEHPDFVSGLIVPMARVGRGLGVHLVLGTQRPRGAVPEAIRSNTNLRIALRTLSEEASRDVIDAPDAARIPPWARGRALVRVSAERLAVFQAAYAGARSLPAGSPEVALDPLPEPLRTGPTDLERLLEAIGAAFRSAPVEVTRPWLEPLPERLQLDLSGPEPTLGLIDDPARQARRPLIWPPDGAPLLCHGNAGSGKSTLLRTLALALAARRGPDQLHLYALDGTGGLSVLEGLPHLAGLAAGGDPERAAALLRRLERELERRRRGGRGSEVLLLVDGLGTFQALFERIEGGRYLELLEELIQDGGGVGVRCAITTSRRRDLARAAWRLLLRPGPEELEAVGLSRRAWPTPPGRGLLPAGLEFQVATVGKGAADEAAMVGEVSRRWVARSGPPPLRTLPVDVDADLLPAPMAELGAVIGLGGEEVEPLELDLAGGHLAICGPGGSGRSTALAALAASLARSPGKPQLVRPRGADRLTRLRALLECPPDRWTVLLLDDADRLSEEAARLLERMVDTEGKLRLVLTLRTRSLRAYAGWPAELRASRRVLLLDPDPTADGDLLGVRLPGPLNRARPGLGVLVLGGAVTPVQVARAMLDR